MLVYDKIVKQMNKFFMTFLFMLISFVPPPLMDRFAIYVIIFLAAFFLSLILNKKYLKLIFDFKDWPLWLFLICLQAGIINATDMGPAWKTLLSLCTAFFIVFYIGKAMFSNDEDIANVIKIIGICSLLVSLIGLLELIFRKNVIYEYLLPNPYYQRYQAHAFIRAISTQFNPVPLGTYLIASLPFNLLLVKQGKNYLLKSLGSIATILSFVVIIFTFSRGCFIGLVSFAILIMFNTKRRNLFWLLVILVGLFIIIDSNLPYPFSKLSLRGFFGFKDSAISSYRSERGAMVGRILQKHPFAGVGLQHLRINFYEYYTGREMVDYEFMIADNMYLTILAETGIIGFIGFVLFIFSVFRKAFKFLNEPERTPEERKRLIFIVCGFIGILINAAAYELFYWRNQLIYFCLFPGIITGLCRRKETSAKEVIRVRQR